MQHLCLLVAAVLNVPSVPTWWATQEGERQLVHGKLHCLA